MSASAPHWTVSSGREFCFGRGAIKHLHRITKQEEWQRLLVVTDRNLVDAGLVGGIVDVLKEAGVEVLIFDGSEVEPSTEHAEQALRLAQGFRPDAWIGLGGGSNLDLAKMCAAADACQVPPIDLFGWNAVPKHSSRLICIPTTAGTGSEVSHAAIVKNAANGRKTPVLSQAVRPAYAIVDPDLLESCPAKVAAESGIDALTHAIESYLTSDHRQFDGSKEPLPYEGSHPLSELYAERAIQLIGRSLVPAVVEKDRQAIEDMAFAASLAGMAFSSSGVSLAHAIEYWVGDCYPCAHGAGNAILLPNVMRHILPARESRLERCAELLGAAPEAEAGIKRVEELRSAVSLPGSLSEVGAKEEDLPAIAQSSFELKRLIDLCPQPTEIADLEKILKWSL